ncbi:hypothetical protein V2S66_23075 [Streptomyces sp. V4-01]|uniref:Uncharacterized protein n=1 Tax=Actinacidiphila polyblastidii TaxID=3110430 RepID=A0ABU7PID4_9ACTN|nr:hypothetical protein [Streptomyces sp. V4-01]
MSVQPVHPGSGPVAALAKTIDAVAGALRGAERMAFYAEVGQTPAGRLETVIETWWARAMLGRVPERDRQVEDALHGRNLVPLDALSVRLGVDLPDQP